MSENSKRTPKQFMSNELIQKSLNNSTMTLNSLNSSSNHGINIGQNLTILTRIGKSKHIRFPKEISLKDILKKNATQRENSTSSYKFNYKSQSINSNFYFRNKSSSIINPKLSKDNVIITSLFTLPFLNKKDRKTISSSQIIPHNKENVNNLKILNQKSQDFPYISRNNDPLINYAISQTESNLSKEDEKINKSVDKINKKNKEDLKLENYMREKFYDDIEKKMAFKLKNKNFCHDSSVKDRLIQMNQIGLFWGGVFEYCNPLLCVKKFKCVKENLFRQRLLKAKLNKNNIIDDDELEYYNLKKKR